MANNTYCKYCWEIIPKNEKHECLGSLRAECNKLLVLATKHCPKEHRDWKELLKY